MQHEQKQTLVLKKDKSVQSNMQHGGTQAHEDVF